ncbi:DUF1516 family protein [Alkalicoccobacillus murimartini]|uniref:Membrane protein SirB2 n=1 Tax=Alkalicoccobacillus murimartini TaxID=171685 RepID=A0ABT9YH65_9BACI|nr:DUF1516 family protein [Alkalicoccobacillus murimartini]MDQ0207199.1 putative membrane protein SirB2 [Alkalicoccobacillus murimartini]
MLTQYHLLAIILTLVLFGLVYSLYRKGQQRKAVILHQVMRVSFLFVLATGILLVPMMPFSILRGGKLLLGIISMGMIEIFLMHLNKGDLTKFTTVSLMIVLFATIMIGLFLPLGIYLRFW